METLILLDAILLYYRNAIHNDPKVEMKKILHSFSDPFKFILQSKDSAKDSPNAVKQKRDKGYYIFKIALLLLLILEIRIL